MTKTLDVSAWPQLAEVLKEIGEDEAIVLTENGRKVAEVKLTEEEIEKATKGWTFGLGVGGKYYMADDFDAELPNSFWFGEE